MKVCTPLIISEPKSNYSSLFRGSKADSRSSGTNSALTKPWEIFPPTSSVTRWTQHTILCFEYSPWCYSPKYNVQDIKISDLWSPQQYLLNNNKTKVWPLRGKQNTSESSPDQLEPKSIPYLHGTIATSRTHLSQGLPSWFSWLLYT